MAQKPCKQCGKDVSTFALKCPSCEVGSPTTTWKDRLIFAGSVILVIWIISTNGPKGDLNYNSPAEQQTQAVAMQALERIKGLDWVQDATYVDFGTVKWEVAILNNGRNPIASASSLCSILYQYDGLVDNNTYVRMVDIKKVIKGQTFTEASMGKVHCSTHETSHP